MIFFCDLIFDRADDQLSFSSDAEDDEQLEDEAASEDQTRQR